MLNMTYIDVLGYAAILSSGICFLFNAAQHDMQSVAMSAIHLCCSSFLYYSYNKLIELYYRDISETNDLLRRSGIRNPRNRAGYVYILKHSHDNKYKIGRTSNPENRLKTFNVKLPFDVEYTHLIKSNDCYELERNLHNLFSEKHINGEWFNLTEEDINLIKEKGCDF